MFSKANLLVVDDIEANVDLLVRRLKRFGYQNVVSASNGQQALGLIREQRFDLVLLDIMMPDLDGYGVLEQLRSEGLLTELPVIMVSSLDDIDSVARCVELGAEDYLPKPFNSTLLRARVKATLEKKQLRDIAKAQLQRLEYETTAARELQLSMLPTEFPQPDAERPLSLYAFMQPANEVGGDLYDFFYPNSHTLCCLVGDVAGKGVASGMFMARARSLIRWVAMHGSQAGINLDAAQITATVNAELCEGNSMVMFVTLCIALLDLRSGELQVCSAGHDLPYILRPSQSLIECDIPTCVPLGIDEDAHYTAHALQLMPSDSFFIYSDGITEARNGLGEFYTEQRLQAELDKLSDTGVQQCIETVVAKVDTFAGSAPQADDITALMLRWHGYGAHSKLSDLANLGH